MSGPQRKTGAAVLEVESTHLDEGSGPVTDSPLYGVALLKIAMELKKPGAPALDDIMAGVLNRMRIPEEAFRSFLAQNGGLLRTIANKRKY